MPTITEFSGEKLLAPATVAEIKNQTETLLKNKDVAGAFQAAAYLKAELAKLPADKVKPVLDVYRAVTANLKVLALPLLEKEEIKNLLANNLSFIDAAFSDTLSASLAAWLALQPEAEAAKVREELLAVLPAGNPLSEKVKRPAAEVALPSGRGDMSLVPPGRLNVVGGNIGTGTDELFDDDEASELANHAAKVNKMGGSPLPIDGVDGLADEILKLNTSAQDGENFKRRAQALAVSRLRDVRTTAEIREYLGRPFAVGGLGLAGDALEKALKLIEQEHSRLHVAGPGKAIAQESLPKADSQPEVVMSPLAEESQRVEVREIPVAVPVAAVKQGAEKPPQGPAAMPATPPIVKIVPPRVARPMQTSGSDKPRLDDIKRPAADITRPSGSSDPSRSKAMSAAGPAIQQSGNIGSGTGDAGQGGKERGPRWQSQGNIGSGTVGEPDELKLLTLDDWRKFGGGHTSANHILEKVAVLDKESLSEKLTAIESFHTSELFREYLSIGRNALSAGRKLAESLADVAVNPNKMTEEEFFAIAELNGKLK